MKASNDRLTTLSEAEQAALYEVPDFDDEQRLDYLHLTPEEQVLMAVAVMIFIVFSVKFDKRSYRW